MVEKRWISKSVRLVTITEIHQATLQAHFGSFDRRLLKAMVVALSRRTLFGTLKETAFPKVCLKFPRSDLIAVLR